MQQSLNDDMDELFRKAAEDYPLKTDGADWDKIAQQLEQPGDAATVPPAPVRRRPKWLLLLLPLLFVGVLGYWLLNSKKTTDTAGKHTPAVQHQPSAAAGSDSAKALTEASQPQQAPADSSTGAHTPTGGQHHAAATGGNTAQVQPRAVKPLTGATQLVKMVPQGAMSAQGRQQPAGITGVGAADSSVVFVAITADSLLMIVPAGNLTEMNGAPQQISDTIPAKKTAQAVTAAQRQEKKKVQVKKGLYAGLIIAPDISTVKLQRVQSMGYGAGIVIGYRISNKVAVETGVLLDRKYYYSKGEYFSTKKIPIPANAKINRVDGWCNMIEIPVSARYFFKVGEKGSWYATAGLSSYLMSKEKYNYSIEQNGTSYDNNWEYKNSSKDWFSIMQAGVGYERNIGVLGVLRVEPYVKLPLNGVGVGSLPISSVGVHIGITKSIR